MKFKFRRLDVPPDDTTENEVRICSSQFEDPSASHRVVRRLLKGKGQLAIPSSICWMGPRTRSQLDVHDNSEVEINRVNQFFGRLWYCNSHLDETVRFSTRIGVWGLFVGSLSISLSLVSIFKS
jgi:hypothetical protein